MKYFLLKESLNKPLIDHDGCRYWTLFLSFLPYSFFIVYIGVFFHVTLKCLAIKLNEVLVNRNSEGKCELKESSLAAYMK